MPLTLQRVSVHAPEAGSPPMLNEVDLMLHEGTVTLLIGRTGSGKSTLLQALAGIRQPSSGDILINGESLWRNGRIDRQKLLRLGMTFQFPEQQLFARNVKTEFDFSLRPYRLATAVQNESIRSASLAFDQENPVFAQDQSPFLLSGGQQRRLALATEFAVPGHWLMMDEPTAGLETAALDQLLHAIRLKKQQNYGIVIATHDLDTFLPIADRVIVLSNGSIVVDVVPNRLNEHAGKLLSAEVGLPSSMKLSSAFAQHGLRLSPNLLKPEQAVDEIEAVIRAGNKSFDENSSNADVAGGSLFTRNVQTDRDEAMPSIASNGTIKDAAWYRRDPRAKWLLYICFVFCTMMQQEWIGLASSAVLLSASFIGLPRTVITGAIRFAKPLLFFAVFSVLLSSFSGFGGEGLIPVQWSADKANATGFNVARLFLVSMASYWLTFVTPYGDMAKGLYWALKPVKRFNFPVEALTVAVALIFRFIPIITSEFQRFSTIVRARGKAVMKPGKIRMRDLPALVIPLLLSLFHRAEAITMGLELKKTSGQPLTVRSNGLAWNKQDTTVIFIAFVCLIVVYVVGRFPQLLL